MKFQKILEAESQSLLSNEDFRKALVRYKILKKHIAAMNNETVHEHTAQPAEGECSICLEPFHRASNVITTRCDHCFHPTCLVRALGTGPCSSCPLCRRTAAGLVPSGPDGDCLRFLAMVYVNTRAAHMCHDAAVRAIEGHLAAARALAPALARSWSGAAARAALEADAGNALLALDAVERMAWLNYEGLRKILKKFDKRTGFCVAAAAGADLRRASFAADTQVRRAAGRVRARAGGGKGRRAAVPDEQAGAAFGRRALGMRERDAGMESYLSPCLSLPPVISP